MGKKILVTPRSFTNHPTSMQLLLDQGYDVVLNPFGRLMTKEEMIEHIADVDGVIIGVDPLDRDVLHAASKLKTIAKYGVGTDNIDLNTADELGISVTVTAGANTEAVADYTFALILGVARKLVETDQACRKLDWSKPSTIDVFGKTIGLIGFGSIGKSVAKRAQGFSMKVLAYDLYPDEAYAAANQIEYVSLERIMAEADFISLHSPLTDETHHMIGREELAQMKPTAVVINTARGGLIDEEALYVALKEKQIWGAGVDVFEEEPPSNKALLELDNIIIGSHCAASTTDAVINMGVMSARNMIEKLS